MKYPYLKDLVLILLIFNARLTGEILRVPQPYSTIQSAINAAAAGDTIIVASGIYKENIVINKAMYLWSDVGPNSTTIEDPEKSSLGGTKETRVISVNSPGYGEIKGFSIVGKYDINGAGIWIEQDGWQISECIISNNWFGINTYAASTKVTGNTFANNIPLAIGSGHRSELINNTIIDNEDGIYAFDSTKVYNNIIANSFHAVVAGGKYDSPIICNNVITSIGTNRGTQQYGIRFNGNDNKATVMNNIIVYCGRDGVFSSYGNLHLSPEYKIAYNNVFDNTTDYSELVGNRTGSDGNISANPLFCDNEGEFFLASDSPCIDRGDLAFLDLDGSRSDIGMYGGAQAKEIRYSPSSFNLLLPTDSSMVNPEGILLKWDVSFDKDSNDEITYRVILGRSKRLYYPNARHIEYRIDAIQDTFYTSKPNYLIQKSLADSSWYFWEVQAIDRGGLFKRSNRFLSFFTSSLITNIVEDNIKAQKLILCQNFPNPFNPSTRISYSVPQDGFVSLKVFDVLGREVAVLVNEVKYAGVYQATFNASSLPSGVYLYKLEAAGKSSVQKMMLIR